MKSVLSYVAVLTIAFLAVSGCGNQVATDVPNTTTIDGKSVQMNTLPDGLKYYDIKTGTGRSPKPGDNVFVQYVGTLLDGTKFDSSYDHSETPTHFQIGVGKVLKGWDEGVLPMKVGGERRLVIPANLAYGSNPPGGTLIPPDAPLVFDIQLVAVAGVSGPPAKRIYPTM